MKKPNRLLVIVLATLLSQTGFAQNSTGNGGIGYLCGGKVILMDYFEALDRDLNIVQPAGTTSVRQILDVWLKQLSRLDDRGVEYRVLANQLLDEVERYRGGNATGDLIRFSSLGNTATDDTNEKINPEPRVGCVKKVQIVIQSKPRYPEDRLFRIDPYYWGLMDDLQKAMTLLHEIIYHDAIRSFRHTDSDGSRYLNGLVASGRIDGMNIVEWTNRLNLANFYTVQFHGLKWRTALPIKMTGDGFQIGDSSLTDLDFIRVFRKNDSGTNLEFSIRSHYFQFFRSTVLNYSESQDRFTGQFIRPYQEPKFSDRASMVSGILWGEKATLEFSNQTLVLKAEAYKERTVGSRWFPITLTLPAGSNDWIAGF